VGQKYIRPLETQNKHIQHTNIQRLVWSIMRKFIYSKHNKFNNNEDHQTNFFISPQTSHTVSYLLNQTNFIIFFLLVFIRI
jgi:hypothetical protein